MITSFNKSKDEDSSPLRYYTVQFCTVTDVSIDRNGFIFRVMHSDLRFGILDPQDEGTAIYRNVGTYLPIYTA